MSIFSVKIANGQNLSINYFTFENIKIKPLSLIKTIAKCITKKKLYEKNLNIPRGSLYKLLNNIKQFL
jgi:hypothetical protein